MHILLFIFYMVVLCYAITRMSFFRNSRIRSGVLLGLFILRVATGCLHNLVAYRYYPHHGDIWTIFQESFITRRELLTNFHSFLSDNSNWEYIQHNVIELVHVLFNLFSFDNLYINTLFFNFFVFWGSIALFRFFMQVFRDDLLPSLTALLLPSTLFWTSCLHAEGFLYLALGFLFFYLLRSRPITPGQIAAVLFFLLLAAFFRVAVVLPLLPALGIWLLAERSSSRRQFWLILSASLAAIVIGVGLQPGLRHQLLFTLSERQQQFQVLFGNSRLYLPLLRPDAGSLLHTLPPALLNGFFEPLPGTGGQRIYSLFSLELIGIWVIGLCAIGARKPPSPAAPSDPQAPSPSGTHFGPAAILFALSGMLVIGLIVPFAGAIIRYRSIFLPFLLAPFLYMLRSYPLPAKINAWLQYTLLSRLPAGTPSHRSKTPKN